MEAKYVINSKENRDFLKNLSQDLLAFGNHFPSPKGSSYYLGDDGTPLTDRPRETWITCRMAHVYSIGSMLGYQGSKDLADAAINGLLYELHDNENGGWYSGITANHEILPNKQCYAHAFVILAATSGLLAKCENAQELLEDALAIYDQKFWNEEEGLACDTWNTEFTKMSDYRGLNANMHTVEAFLAASDVTGNEKYRIRAGRIIERVIKWSKTNNWRIPEHFTKEWVAELNFNKEHPTDPFKPYGATPGHGIEWSRLIVQWALSTYKEDVSLSSSYIESAELLFKRAILDAWNVDGAPGIVYTTDWDGKQYYADLYSEFMKYLDKNVLDHVNGSWFHQLDEKNQLLNTVWPGKPDLYHAFQATLIPYSRVDLSIACWVKEAWAQGGLL